MSSAITFFEYLWQLRPPYLSRVITGVSAARGLLQVFGNALEVLRTNVARAVAQFTVTTAEGSYLDEHGKVRGAPRVVDAGGTPETDSVYRAWLLGHFERSKYRGNQSYYVAILARYGFDITVQEKYTTYGPKGPIYTRTDWSVFTVTLNSTTGAYDDSVFFNLVRALKPAHTKIVFVFGPGIVGKNFDTGWNFDTGLTFDRF